MRYPRQLVTAIHHAPVCHHRQRGSALVEYTIVVMFLVVVLVATNGNVIHELVEAVRDAYAAFVYALSISWA